MGVGRRTRPFLIPGCCPLLPLAGRRINWLLSDSAAIANFTPDEKAKYEQNMTTERDLRIPPTWSPGLPASRRRKSRDCCKTPSMTPKATSCNRVTLRQRLERLPKNQEKDAVVVINEGGARLLALLLLSRIGTNTPQPVVPTSPWPGGEVASIYSLFRH